MVSEMILEMKDIVKSFPGVRALDHVNFDLRKGEVHVLLGENGAGKSTLIKILSGAYRKDEGQILLNGREVDISSPRAGQLLGIGTIYQELTLAPRLSVAENLVLGQEPVRFGQFLDHSEAKKRALEYLDMLHIKVDPHTPVGRLGVALQQMVAIAKALTMDANIVIMDEPTAALTSEEIQELFRVVHRLKEKGVSIIYISHRLEEIFEVGDRVTVLRDGKYVGTRNMSEVTIDELIRMMVGRDLTEEYPRTVKPTYDESPMLRVEGLRSHDFIEIDTLEVHRGEIVGLYGLMGSGRTETARAIFGADPKESGRIYFEGQPVDIRTPADAIAAGMGFVTEDRKAQGLLLGMPVKDNITLAALDQASRFGFINYAREQTIATKFVNELRIRTAGLGQLVGNLSGGNQQKVILAKWLATQSKFLIFDEPTRGIDVGAKVEVRRLMNDLTARGAGILMISSELPEILGMSDRILVMREGRIVAELSKDKANQEIILGLATGAMNHATDN